MSNNEIIVTRDGKKLINKQLKGPALSIVGFVPFYSLEDVFDVNSNKNTLLYDAMGGLYNNYYFNGLNYIYNNEDVVPENKDDEYKDLFDLITDKRLYNVKYTNSTNSENSNIGIYNLNLNIDDIKVNFSTSTTHPELKVNGLAIFAQENVSKETVSLNSVELFAIIKFEHEVDLVKRDINWTLALDSKGNFDYNLLVDEPLTDFNSLANTEKSNVHSASNLNINEIPYTFSDDFVDRGKTWYYSTDWKLGFVKGDKNEYQYDMTLINDSANENGFFFSIDNNTNTLNMQNTIRNATIVFGTPSDNYKGEDALLLGSNSLNAESSYGIFNVDSNGKYENSNHIFVIGENTGNNIENSKNVTFVGGNNSANNSNNVFTRGNNNVINGENDFIAGDDNYVNVNDTYVLGGGISSNVNSSINFGFNYTNNDFTFDYGNDSRIYGFERDYGNFVIKGKDNGSNVQLSQDSLYLMDSYKKVNPSGTKNSLLVNTTNVSSENSLVYGDFNKFVNSKLENSISVASSTNAPNTIKRDRENSIIKNSLDLTNNTNNIEANNSIIYGSNVSSKNGIIIDNSLVSDVSADNGYIINSLILKSDISGNAYITNSLIVNDTSKEISNAKIENSVIQGNSRNSTFINSHLIGDLPNGVNKEFKDCLVIADGNDYVAIYADEIVKTIKGNECHIPWKYSLIKTYMDEDCARGKEWLHDDIEQTYEDKITTLLENQKIFYRNNINYNDVLFAGEILDGKSKCFASMTVIGEELYFDIELAFDISDNTVTYDIKNYGYTNYLETTRNLHFSYDTNIVNHLTFGKNGNKIYIINKILDKNIFVIYGFSTCNILSDTNNSITTTMKPSLVSRPLYAIETNFATQYNVDYVQTGNFVKSENCYFRGDCTIKSTNGIYTYNPELNIKLGTLNNLKDEEEYKPYETLAVYLVSGAKYYLKYTDGSFEEFDSMYSKNYTYDFPNKLEGHDGEHCLISAYNYSNNSKTRLINIEDGLPINDGTNTYNGYSIDNLLSEDTDDLDSFVKKSSDNTEYVLYNMDKLTPTKNTFYMFTRRDEEEWTDIDTSKDVLSPIYTYKSKIGSKRSLFNFTKVFLWGRMSNVTVYTSNFDINEGVNDFYKPNSFNQLPIMTFHSKIKPIMPLLSYVIFSNYGELYPFNVASYRLSNASGKLYLNIHKKPGEYDLLTYLDGTSSYKKLKRYYYNPFIKINESNEIGMIRHEFTYIMNSLLNTSTSSYNNNLFNKHKNELNGKQYTILRLHDCHYI